jgi:hypothetical protein
MADIERQGNVTAARRSADRSVSLMREAALLDP